ncbi:MAG: methyltransferase domain-containing protein, partial [Rickettsiales bacterium]|nr:methyltransferase domain-containing protein [Rickettsiales bacterium]
QLARQEDQPMLSHFLAMSQNHTPATAPLAYAQSLYDGFATQYDYYQQDVMSYQAPKAAAATLKDWQESHGRTLSTLLDLGCGTGLAAAALQELVPLRTGVDCSPLMLAKARGKKLYEHLHLDDMTAFMLQSPERYDVAVAIDALCHTGDLIPFLRAARNVVAQGGALLFTTEKDFQCETYRLGASGRYTHAPNYVRASLEEKGFDLIDQEDFTLYIDNTLAASGQLWLAQKMQTH